MIWLWSYLIATAIMTGLTWRALPDDDPRLRGMFAVMVGAVSPAILTLAALVCVVAAICATAVGTAGVLAFIVIHTIKAFEGNPT